MRSISLLSLIVAVTSAAFAQVPTGKLPRAIVPTHYALTLELDPARDGFTGEVRIRVQSTEPARTFFLHGKDLEILRASATPWAAQRPRCTREAVDESGVLALTAEQPLPAGELELALSFRAAYFGQLDSTYKVAWPSART